MPRKPKKLVPWLIKVLDERLYEDLNMKWEDRECMKFWLPWPRQKNKGWEEPISRIFLDYVKMQGRYKEGDEKKYVEWKASFRTALHKDSSLTEIQHTDKRMKLFKITLANQCPSRTSSTCSSPDYQVSSPSSSPQQDSLNAEGLQLYAETSPEQPSVVFISHNYEIPKDNQVPLVIFEDDVESGQIEEEMELIALTDDPEDQELCSAAEEPSNVLYSNITYYINDSTCPPEEHDEQMFADEDDIPKMDVGPLTSTSFENFFNNIVMQISTISSIIWKLDLSRLFSSVTCIFV